MAMTMAGKGGPQATINITPMIDILLVLLILFMVITPLTSRGLNALVPAPPEPDTRPAPVAGPIVVSVHAGSVLQLNQEPVAAEALAGRLRGLFGMAGNRVVFVRGDRDLLFQEVAWVVDAARGAGFERIALMTN